MFKIILNNFHLEKIFWIIKNKIKYMILVGLVFSFLGAAFALATQETTYMARISFYVYTDPDYINESGVNLSASEVASAKTLLDSYMQILRSTTFLKEVIEELDLKDSGYSATYLQRHISSAAEENTAVFYVFVHDYDAKRAQDIANAIGKLAPDKIIGIVKSGGIEVLDPAELPTTANKSTNVVLYAILGGVGGAGIVAMVALVLGLLDTTIRRKYEISDLFTIPIIGTVPEIGNVDANCNVKKTLGMESPFIYKEAYNDIRTCLIYKGKDEECPVYGFTSADSGEGKTLNSINVAKSFSALGKRVVLIDADMRNGGVAAELGISSNANGLSEYLTGVIKKFEVVRVENNFFTIVSGAVPPNPSELLSGEGFRRLISELKNLCDVILIDLPPAGVVSDAMVISDVLTGYILVVREMVTKFDREEMVVAKLETVGANICGFIYNGISVNSPDYNHKSYGYDKSYEKQGVVKDAED